MTSEIKDIVRGDTRSPIIIVRDRNKNVFDVTGYTVKVYGKINIKDNERIINKDGYVVNGPEGKIGFTLDISDTDREFCKVYYRVVIMKGSIVKTVKNSTFKIVPGI